MDDAGPTPAPSHAPASAVPQSANELFFAFNRLALQGFLDEYGDSGADVPADDAT